MSIHRESKIGVLVIGQTHRPDLVDPLRYYLPTARLIEVGALDGLTHAELPESGSAAYPLITRMSDGTLVTAPESFLIARLQDKLGELEASGVSASILLCAGTFAALRSSCPFFRPFETGRQIIQTMGLTRLGLIAPIPAQEAPIQTRWAAAGFQPTVWTADVANPDAAFMALLNERIATANLQAIVLDYVGHDSQHVRAIQSQVGIPVLDLGMLCMAALASSVG